MEQLTVEKGPSGPHLLIPESRCPSPATETDANSLLWLSSDDYLADDSASSDNDTLGVNPLLEVKCGSRHRLNKFNGDDESPKPIGPSHYSKHFAEDASSCSYGKPGSCLVPFRQQRESKSYTAYPDKASEESDQASAYHIQHSASSSPISLEESIIAYFATRNLETSGFSRPVSVTPTKVPLSLRPERHGTEHSYSWPDKRPPYILTSVSEKHDQDSTHSAPERSPSNPLDGVTREELQRRRFGPLWTMDHYSLVCLAVDVRNSMLTNHEDCLSCRVVDQLSGSFNMVYILQFDDGLKYVIRLPALGWGNRWTPAAKKAFDSQVLTMHMIRRTTNIPLPDILAFDSTQGNSLGTPYMVISFISGATVEELWCDETGPTPLEERRSRILSTTAMAMAQLQSLKFNWIGSLQLKDDPEENSLGIGSCYEWNLPSRYAELNGQDPDIKEFGPFRTTNEYLNYLHDSQERDPHPMDVGCRELLARMIASLPLSVGKTHDGGNDEIFVLTAPDFDSQNFMVDEQGNLTGIIDWDHVQTMPLFLGYCRYPEWITRDCDPLFYSYPSNAMEGSPDHLRQYRQYYAAEMVRLLHNDDAARFAKKSHIFGSVWIAASRYDCQVSLLAKLLDRALARDGHLNKFALMEDIGEGNWVISEAKMMDRFQALFKV
ncbi:hypothetical protein MMC29_006739 [Sticta canariensis]|nr:hypothetical protein [Sticta canariensis]